MELRIPVHNQSKLPYTSAYLTFTLSTPILLLCKNSLRKLLHDAHINHTVAYKTCHQNTLNNLQTLIKCRGGLKRLKLLLDEMYAGLKEYFEILGYETLTVQEVGLQGAKDKDIVEYAKKNNLLLITQDQKPAELAGLMGVKCVLISNAMIAKIADEKIKEKYPEMKKHKP
jgi:predicted nuclease of predicted toxin-antitoxin system